MNENYSKDRKVLIALIWMILLILIHCTCSCSPIEPQWELNIIDAKKAWQYASGKTVKIAVVDTGVNNDYNFSLLEGFNTLNNSCDTVDDNGHGTIVAGLAAGNGPKYYGVAPSAQIIPVKVASCNGSAENVKVAEGIIWAVDHGADIINLSLSSPRYCKVVNYAVNYSNEHNVIIVAAAGDGGYKNADFPASSEKVISVSSFGKENEKLDFVNYYNNIDVLAPGSEIERKINNYKHTIKGTSASTPIVSGAIALLLEINPSLNSNDIKYIVDNGNPPDKRLNVCKIVAFTKQTYPLLQPKDRNIPQTENFDNKNDDYLTLDYLHLLPDSLCLYSDSNSVTLSVLEDCLRKVTFNQNLVLSGSRDKILTKTELIMEIINNTDLRHNLISNDHAEYSKIALDYNLIDISLSARSNNNQIATANDLYHALISVMNSE